MKEASTHQGGQNAQSSVVQIHPGACHCGKLSCIKCPQCEAYICADCSNPSPEHSRHCLICKPVYR